jgi:hypothetical protein
LSFPRFVIDTGNAAVLAGTAFWVSACSTSTPYTGRTVVMTRFEVAVCATPFESV